MMAYTLLSQKGVSEKLRREVDICGSQEKYGLEHDVAPSVISGVLTGKRKPPPALLDALDLELVLMYRKKNKQWVMDEV